MAKPKLATSRPAALTGTLGQGGVNRPHDVALVQALLGARRDKRGRPYLRERVTGKYDRDTAEALLSYRMDQRDGNIKRPLNARGPMLNKLAQGQSLAVLEGTATPYSYKPIAEASPIKGPDAGKLGAERKVELKQVMLELTRDYGISFDVEIKAVTGSARSIASTPLESRPLVGRFTPRNFSVHGGQRLSPVMSNTVFRDRIKELHDTLAADIKARCAEAFGVKDPVDLKIQQNLKNDLACVVRTDLEGVDALAQFILAGFHKFGLTLAARFFENYLNKKMPFISVGRNEAFEFDLVANAVEENTERFKQKNFVAPVSGNPAFLVVETITKNPNIKSGVFRDHWKADINFTSDSGRRRFLSAGAFDPQDTLSAFFAAGSSSLISTGDFHLTRQGDRILVTGTISHLWTDLKYDFNLGELFHPESQILEKHGKAKPFKWEAGWNDIVDGELLIGTFLPRARGSQSLRRRWIRFETRPGP